LIDALIFFNLGSCMTSTDDDFLMTVVSLNDVIKNCTNMYVYVLWLTFMIDIMADTVRRHFGSDDTRHPTSKQFFFFIFMYSYILIRRFDVV